MVKIIGQYVLNSVIGRGQYGEVFKGYNKVTGQRVAIKAIDRSKLKGKYTELLITEIEVLKSCDNPNIIKLYDIKKTSKNIYLVLEYCNQGDLENYIKQNGILSEEQAIEIFVQILNAFKTLNKLHIMHRDFKLPNLLLNNGEVKVADFGFSKILGINSCAHTMLGSPLNMAPEVLQGDPYTNKADIWSLGVCLYEMLIGYPPYEASNIVKLLELIKIQDVEFPNKPKISKSLKSLIRKMLIINQYDRIGWDELFNSEICKKQQQKALSGLKETSLEKISEYFVDDVVKKDQFSQVNNSFCSLVESEKQFQQQLDVSKNNTARLLHERNKYVYISRLVEKVIATNTKYSEELGVLLVKKCYEILKNLKISLDLEQNKFDLDNFQEYIKQKECQSVKQFVEEEYEIFKKYHDNLIDQVKQKIKRQKENSQNLFQIIDLQTLMDINRYIKLYLDYFLQVYLKNQNKKLSVKFLIFLNQLVDCLNSEQVYFFNKKDDQFDFEIFYKKLEGLDRISLFEIVKKKLSYEDIQLKEPIFD